VTTKDPAAAPVPVPVPATATATGPYHILASAVPADGRTRVLKHADTFAVLDHYGDITPGGLGEEGLYHAGTRYLSGFVLELEQGRPFLLNSTTGDDGDQLVVALTNPDVLTGGKLRLPLGTLHLTAKKFLWQGVLYQELRIVNHGLDAVAVSLVWHFEADYADIYEVRGMKRQARGQDLTAEVTANGVTLGYCGRDDVVRRTLLRFDPPPTAATASSVRHEILLDAREAITLVATIACERVTTASPPLTFAQAQTAAQTDLRRRKAADCGVYTSDAQVDGWIGRAMTDVRLLTTELPTGPYPYAGIPWFNTPFGRDGIITAFECLWLQPLLARGVLAYLAATQATEFAPEQDAEPGKILHETRAGEMAVLKEMPFGRYYGSVDSTPLFVMLAGAYFERTGDLPFVRSIWPSIEAALDWLDRYGDRDGDGFVEYERQSSAGLLHQGWKDADDAVVHADGTIAEGPIAMSEVQGYVFAALQAGAMLAEVLMMHAHGETWRRQAEQLRTRFDDAFWCDELSTYALALDGEKRPCRVRASNAGQGLFSGIVAPHRVGPVVRTLMSADLFSGWGVRTLAASEARYNPMGYHTGAVWPHDNALIAHGVAACGHRKEAARLLDALFDASLHFDLQRMPELFCGFPREAGEPPVPYPLACAPQAWAAGSVLLLLQACLGLRVDGRTSRVLFTRPRLPARLRELSIDNLDVGGARVDLRLFRHGETVGLNVLRRDGGVEVVLT
jgi:glycogen debranching enzyme